MKISVQCVYFETISNTATTSTGIGKTSVRVKLLLISQTRDIPTEKPSVRLELPRRDCPVVLRLGLVFQRVVKQTSSKVNVHSPCV